jgi:hypothetical protein
MIFGLSRSAASENPQKSDEKNLNLTAPEVSPYNRDVERHPSVADDKAGRPFTKKSVCGRHKRSRSCR